MISGDNWHKLVVLEVTFQKVTCDVAQGYVFWHKASWDVILQRLTMAVSMSVPEIHTIITVRNISPDQTVCQGYIVSMYVSKT